MKELEKPEQMDAKETELNGQSETQPSGEKKRLPVIAIILFFILVGLISGAGFLGWQQFLKYNQSNQNVFDELKAEIEDRATLSQLDKKVAPLQQSVGKSDNRLVELEQQQKGLLSSIEKLYELYGRDENGWKLAEVEYLLSIAQHKLVLENDFEGAAKTLNAASERIALLADPGLLPVRVQINDEISQLKTRVRPDLVGMTLLVSRLSRQITYLKPGYQSRSEETDSTVPISTPDVEDKRGYDQKAIDFVKSLVTIKTSKPEIKQSQQTIIVDVAEKLEDNLKLTRWSLLERDVFQYDRLMKDNVELFEQYYDLENAANSDFYESLLDLQKSSLKPDLPDIGESLRLLKLIQQQRENNVKPEAQQESDNG
jgi:uroporphyrin-3 C-methyltransferase